MSPHAEWRDGSAREAKSARMPGQIGKIKTRPKPPAALCREDIETNEGRSALQPLIAFAVIAAALLDPLHAAVAICGLVGVVLIDAGVHASLARAFLGVFRIDR